MKKDDSEVSDLGTLENKDECRRSRLEGGFKKNPRIWTLTSDYDILTRHPCGEVDWKVCLQDWSSRKRSEIEKFWNHPCRTGTEEVRLEERSMSRDEGRSKSWASECTNI